MKTPSAVRSSKELATALAELVELGLLKIDWDGEEARIGLTAAGESALAAARPTCIGGAA